MRITGKETRVDPAKGAPRCVTSRHTPVHNRDLMTGLGQLVRDGGTDDARADNDDSLRHLRTPFTGHPRPADPTHKPLRDRAKPFTLTP